MDLTQDSFYQEKFTKQTIDNQTLNEKEFEDCQFIECSFLNTKFDKCTFINCTFKNCTLSAVDISQSRFVDVTFAHSKALGIDWTKTQDVQGLTFHHCQINYSNFQSLKLPKITITHCEAKELELSEADLHESDFSHTNFEGTVFNKTNLTKTNFSYATNYYIDPRLNTIKKAIFTLPDAVNLLHCFGVVIN